VVEKRSIWLHCIFLSINNIVIICQVHRQHSSHNRLLPILSLENGLVMDSIISIVWKLISGQVDIWTMGDNIAFYLNFIVDKIHVGHNQHTFCSLPCEIFVWLILSLLSITSRFLFIKLLYFGQSSTFWSDLFLLFLSSVTMYHPVLHKLMRYLSTFLCVMYIFLWCKIYCFTVGIVYWFLSFYLYWSALGSI